MISPNGNVEKLLSAIFYQIFIFSSNDSLSKTMKMFFISSKKLFSFSRYSSLCNFFPSFPHFPDSKRQKEVEKFILSPIGLHKLPDVIFRITQKPLYIASTNLFR